MTNGLKATNLILAYRMSAGIHTVLNLEELIVPAGSVVGITGPSGSGKTSLLHVLGGLERPQYGSVCWGGDDLCRLTETERDRWRRERVGMIFQDFHLLPGMTALQNVLVPATFDRFVLSGQVKDRARALLTHVGVPGGLQRVETLSRGEMQRVAVARALLFAPSIVLADEPTASLDGASSERVTMLLLDSCREARTTVVIVSHDSAVLRRLDAVHTLVGGRLTTTAQDTVSRC